jgi:hypothetical protein
MIVTFQHISSSLEMAKKLRKIPNPALTTTPLRSKFASRTIQLLSCYIADLRFDSLREQVYKISKVIANGAYISMTDADRSLIFGRKGSWSRGMMNEYLHQLSAPNAFDPGRPRLVHDALEEGVVRLWLTRQHDRAPATFSDVTDLLTGKRNACASRRQRSLKEIGPTFGLTA